MFKILFGVKHVTRVTVKVPIRTHIFCPFLRKRRPVIVVEESIRAVHIFLPRVCTTEVNVKLLQLIFNIILGYQYNTRYFLNENYARKKYNHWNKLIMQAIEYHRYATHHYCSVLRCLSWTKKTKVNIPTYF